MLFSVGANCIKGHITYDNYQEIKNSTSPPTSGLWEKIKDFFFSTHHNDALKCLHDICHYNYPLYHDGDPQFHWEDIDAQFEKLKALASDGHRDKFKIIHNEFMTAYCVDSVVLLSMPADTRTVLNYNEAAEALDFLARNNLDRQNIERGGDALDLITENTLDHKNIEQGSDALNLISENTLEHKNAELTGFLLNVSVLMEKISTHSKYTFSNVKLIAKVIKEKSKEEIGEMNRIKKEIKNEINEYRKNENPIHEENIKKKLLVLLCECKMMELLPSKIKESDGFKLIHSAVTKYSENMK